MCDRLCHSLPPEDVGKTMDMTIPRVLRLSFFRNPASRARIDVLVKQVSRACMQASRGLLAHVVCYHEAYPVAIQEGDPLGTLGPLEGFRWKRALGWWYNANKVSL